MNKNLFFFVIGLVAAAVALAFFFSCHCSEEGCECKGAHKAA